MADFKDMGYVFWGLLLCCLADLGEKFAGLNRAFRFCFVLSLEVRDCSEERNARVVLLCKGSLSWDEN